MLLVAALNGGRSRSAHSAIPISAAELAIAAREAAEAGADAVHFHVRGPTECESLAAPDVAQAVAAIRPLGLPFGVSTGAWIISDPAERMDAIAGWAVLPEFASINFDEEGAAPLGRHLLERGVDIEAGVANRFAAEQLTRSGFAGRCIRVMFEPREQSLAEALASVSAAADVLDAAGVNCPRLLHGVDATAWTLLDEAATRRYDARIGFEDTLTLPDGGIARSNADLVRAAWARIRHST
jgi:uncharacterized protein (DUF849 family)